MVNVNTGTQGLAAPVAAISSNQTVGRETAADLSSVFTYEVFDSESDDDDDDAFAALRR